MKKRLCVLSDFSVFQENTDDAYVCWIEIKDVLWTNDYRKLIKYLVPLRVWLPREWLPIKYLKQFLETLN